MKKILTILCIAACIAPCIAAQAAKSPAPGEQAQKSSGVNAEEFWRLQAYVNANDTLNARLEPLQAQIQPLQQQQRVLMEEWAQLIAALEKKYPGKTWDTSKHKLVDKPTPAKPAEKSTTPVRK